MVQITIRKAANGKRRAFYRNSRNGVWFSLPVAQAAKALRDGRINIGADRNVPVTQ